MTLNKDNDVCGPVGENFIWGVAAASAQTESRDGRGRSNWDVFADTPGNIADGSTNARANEFEVRYPEELELLEAARVPAFRLSLSWPRIQPDGPGSFNQAGIDTYARMFDAMRERGIEPWVTMFHWDTPVWAGDFRSRDIASRMADYADILVDKLGDRVKRWIILNEPNTVALLGYGAGMHAPGVQDGIFAAIHHQNLALGLMTQAARARAADDVLIGTTHNVTPVCPASQSDADRGAAALVDSLWNWAFMDPLFGRGYPDLVGNLIAPLIKNGDLETIAASPDFLGVNYYCRLPVAASDEAPGFQIAPWNPDLEQTALFPIEPDGLTEVLLDLKQRYDLPLYVTETGFALDGEDDWETLIQDDRRENYVEQYLAACASAKAQGADLRGIFYWTATDNWEWAAGFSKRFGLIAVERETQRREAKNSLAAFGEQVERHFPNALASLRQP